MDDREVPSGSARFQLPSLHIALVCDWFLPRIGGIERHLDQLSRELAAANHRVTVITPTRGTPVAGSGVRVHRLPARLIAGVGLIWTPSSFRRLGAVIREGRFDVVHVHCSIISPAAYAAVYFAQRAGLPTVVTGHSILGVFGPAFRRINQWVGWSQWPVAFSSVSERVARELGSVANGVQVDVLPNAIDPEEWRLDHRPPRDTIQIACVMRLAPRKRGTALLQALRTARDILPADIKVKLQIAGDGSERSRLERLARKLGLSPMVVFRGAQTQAQIRALLAESHFYVLPSELEAFGIAALEARATGLPVVAMRAGGVKEFIRHGVEGLLADDDREFAQHLVRLCEDAALRGQITSHNQRTPTRFTWEHTLAAHYRTYARARELQGHELKYIGVAATQKC